MYNLKFSEYKLLLKKRAIGSAIVGIVVLLLVILCSSLISNKHSFDSNIMAIDVSVEEISGSDDNTMYKATYKYVVDGSEYYCTSTTAFNPKDNEENRIVYYDSMNPSRCMATPEVKNNYTFFLFPVVFGICFIISIIQTVTLKRKMNKIIEFSKHAKIIKNLPFEVENFAKTYMHKEVGFNEPYKIVVEYGGRIFKSDYRYDFGEFSSHNKVDLLIDETNSDNYYIDYDINN